MKSKPNYEHVNTLTLQPGNSGTGCPSHAGMIKFDYFAGNPNFTRHPSSTDTVIGFICQVCGTEIWFKKLTDTTLL